MEILLKSFYDMNNETGYINDVDISSISILDEYIENTVSFTLNVSKKAQSYEVQRPTNEIYAMIKELFINEFSPSTFNTNGKYTANKLLEAEQGLKGAAKAKQGALIQALIKSNETQYFYVLLKNEFFKAINRDSLKLVEAFLYDESKKTPLKICVFDISYDIISNEISINNIKIDDSISNDHADYWYNTFLSMKKCKTDILNTKNAMSSIVGFWGNELKTKPLLMRDVRNETISYFRQNEKFDIDSYKTMVSNIDEEVDNIVQNSFNNYIEEKKESFDGSFNIDSEAVKKYRKTYSNYRIKEGLILQVQNISLNNIVYKKTTEQDDYLLIKTENQELLSQFEELDI